MPKFRKKPVVIQATRWWKNGDHPQDGDQSLAPALRAEGKVVRRFRRPDVHASTLCAHCEHRMGDHGWIDTLEGGHIVCPGDWVITGVVGERYPCKANVFETTYEAVS